MSLPTPTKNRFDSDAIADGEAFGRYHDLYAAGTDVSRAGPDFRARFTLSHLGPLVLFDRTLNDVAHERTSARVRGDDFTHCTLQLVLSGRMVVEHGDRVETAGRGDIVLLDHTQPQRTTAFQAHLLMLSLPRELVGRSTSQVSALHARILGTPQAGLLGDVMTSIVARRLGEATGEPAPLVAMIEAALGLALRSQDAAPVRDRQAPGVLDRVRLVVEAHLSRRDLTPAMVSQLAGVSRTVLYDLFKPLGGISHYIQERRVARLRSLVTQPHLRAASVKQLAAQAGFASTSHANRSFSNAYGTTPGRLRGELGDDRAAGA